MIRLDRRLFSATVYPADYGFVPDTLAEDGDPLDALVLLEDPTFPGCWVRGAARSACSGWRTRRAPTPRSSACRSTTPSTRACTTSTSCRPHLLDEIEHFFDVYKMLEPDKNTTTRGFEGRDAAWPRSTGLPRAVPRLSLRRPTALWARRRRPSTAPRSGRRARAARRGCPARRSDRRRPRGCGRRCARSGDGGRSAASCGRSTTSPIARCTRASVLRSRLAVASSSRRIAGSTSSARARQRSWRCPADSERPRSVTGWR